MKKLLFISFLFISLSSFSQGNLQFNKVINLNYKGMASQASETIASSVTIPDGKVWKITYSYLNAADESRNYRPYSARIVELTLKIGDIYIDHMTGQTHPGYNNGIVWLDSGSKNITINNNETYNAGYNLSITAIEFNVVQ